MQSSVGDKSCSPGSADARQCFHVSECGVKVRLLSKSAATLSRHRPQEAPEDSAGVLSSPTLGAVVVVSIRPGDAGKTRALWPCSLPSDWATRRAEHL